MFLCIPHQSLTTRHAGKGTTPHLRNAASASRHDSQETEMLDEDSERSSVVDMWLQRDMWLHVAYGV